ncbi:MAG TPA: right-handed parallel beta-helix repeat-containing protein [Pilimelia sp.]|nr:right-handed parallel beta-helix repeat-containing protein [Pilimelia sp.]
MVHEGLAGRRPWRTALAAGVAAATVAAVVLLGGGSASAATLFADDFADGNSAGWTPSGGAWAVVPDGTPALRQSGTSADARARAGSASWTDYTVTARVRPISFAGSNRFVAVLARAQSATSYYYLALRSNNTVELKKLVNGAAATLATAAVPVSAGGWYALSLQVTGASLRGTVNGGAAVTATDTQFAAGQVGVATFFASASFDDVAVETAAGGPPTATGPPTAPPAASPSASPPGQAPATDAPLGFASVNALGQNGTTGGAGGRVVTATNATQFLEYIDSSERLIIQVNGTIAITSKQGVRPNKTIVGIGNSGHITGGGLDFYRSFNVIVRNLRFTNAEDDAVNVGQESHHIWIDHNTFSGAVDGSVDIVRGADYVTVSWNHFDHADKSMLIGHSDGAASTDVGHLRVTIHHNFFDNSRQRHPRVRFADPVHVLNNYFLNNELYGVAAVQGSGVLVEGNYFENVAVPIVSTSGYADSGPGRAVERNNVYVGSGQPQVGGAVVEPRTFYSYAVESPAGIPARVRAGAGAGRG